MFHSSYFTNAIWLIPFLVFSPLCFSKEPYELAKGCPNDYEGMLVNPSFGKKHVLKDGKTTLWLCGSGNQGNYYGPIFIKKNTKDTLKEISYLGGISDTVDQLSVNTVKVSFSDSGYSITNLIPYKDSKIESFISEYNCLRSTDCSPVYEQNCAFKKLNKKPSSIALKKLRAYWKGQNITEDIIDLIFNVYYQALDGDKDSLNYFLKSEYVDKVLLKRVLQDPKYANHVDIDSAVESSYFSINQILKTLKEKCRI